MSVAARQPPQNQGDAASACTDSAESHIAIAIIFSVPVTLNLAAIVTIVAAIVAASLSLLTPPPPPLQPPPLQPPPPLLLLLTSQVFKEGILWQIINVNKTKILLDGRKTRANLLLENWLVAKLLLAYTGFFVSNAAAECMLPHWQLPTSATQAEREKIRVDL